MLKNFIKCPKLYWTFSKGVWYNCDNNPVTGFMQIW